MRQIFAFASLVLVFSPSLASDEQVIEDCDYWRLAKDDTDKAKRLAACDRIIMEKSFSQADRAMAYAERASEASSAGRKDDALVDLDQSLALEPDHLERLHDRAYLLHFKGEHGRAIEDFDKVLAAKPDGHVMFYRGLSYLAKGDEARGFADLGKGIELAPDRYFLRYQRGLEYAKRGHANAALGDVDKAIALKNDDRGSYLLRAELYTKTGDIEKAITDLTRAAELDPKYALLPYSNRALLYEQTKQYDRAIGDYDKLLSLSPGDAYYTRRRAALLENLARAPRPIMPSASKTVPMVEPQRKAESPQAPLPVPPTVAPAPPAKVTATPGIAGKGECRRFDAIANMTIAVACPD